MFNFENWFLCQFSSNTRFSFGEGSLNTPKIGKHKKEFTNINLRRSKTQKAWRGGSHGRNQYQNFRFYKCYDICFYNFCEKNSYGKKTLVKSEKKMSSNIPLLFLDAAGGQISDLWLYFHFLFLLHLLLAQLAPFFIYLEYLNVEKMMTMDKIYIWNICMWRKWEAKFRNPWWHSSHCSYSTLGW